MFCENHSLQPPRKHPTSPHATFQGSAWGLFPIDISVMLYMNSVDVLKYLSEPKIENGATRVLTSWFFSLLYSSIENNPVSSGSSGKTREPPELTRIPHVFSLYPSSAGISGSFPRHFPSSESGLVQYQRIYLDVCTTVYLRSGGMIVPGYFGSDRVEA